MINRVVLVGRTTNDITLKKTQSGKSVCSFTLAVDGRNNSADFINCVAWNQTAELLATYVKKGHLLGLEGRISTRNYDDPNGKKVYVTEVVADSVTFLEKKDKIVEDTTPVQEKPAISIYDNDLPF